MSLLSSRRHLNTCLAKADEFNTRAAQRSEKRHSINKHGSEQQTASSERSTTTLNRTRRENNRRHNTVVCLSVFVYGRLWVFALCACLCRWNTCSFIKRRGQRPINAMRYSSNRLILQANLDRTPLPDPGNHWRMKMSELAVFLLFIKCSLDTLPSV